MDVTNEQPVGSESSANSPSPCAEHFQRRVVVTVVVVVACLLALDAAQISLYNVVADYLRSGSVRSVWVRRVLRDVENGISGTCFSAIIAQILLAVAFTSLGVGSNLKRVLFGTLLIVARRIGFRLVRIGASA